MRVTPNAKHAITVKYLTIDVLDEMFVLLMPTAELRRFLGDVLVSLFIAILATK